MRPEATRRGQRVGLAMVWILAFSTAAAEASRPEVGLLVDHSSRTVAWDAASEASKMLMGRIGVEGRLKVSDRLSASLATGLTLTDFDDLVFRGLPVSLAYGGSPVAGFSLGLGLKARLFDLGDLEISAVGGAVSSLGLEKTWTLEGFAVPGRARGRASWIEAFAGPQAVLTSFGRFRPFLEAAVRLLWANFRMEETLEDLRGGETKTVKGDFAVSFALGADLRLSRRMTAGFKAGMLPYPGGVDAILSAGLRLTL